MKRVTLTLLLLFLYTAAPAQQANLNLDKARYGFEAASPTARGLALGNSGLANGGVLLAASHNPALLAHADSGLVLQAGAAFLSVQEDRSFPYYDNFGGFVDYGSYYFQDNNYSGFSAQLVYSLKGVLPDMPLAVSVGWMPFLDFNYDYFEEVRSTSFGDKLLAYNVFGSEGVLYTLPVTVAAAFDNFSVGLSVALLNGDVNTVNRVEPKALGLDSLARESVLRRRAVNTPVYINAGFSFRVDERLSVGGSFRSGFEYQTENLLTSADTSQTLTQAVAYPARVGFGFDYRFRNILQARLMVDFYYNFWSTLSDDLYQAPDYNDTYNIRVGVEHVFFNDFAFRVGYSFENMRENRELTRTLLTGGLGYRWKNIDLNLGLGLSAMEFYQADLYDDAAYDSNVSSRTQNDLVKWNETYGKLDFIIHL